MQTKISGTWKMTDLYVKSKTTYKKQISFSKYIFSPLRGLDHSLLLTVCACFPTCVRAIHNSVRKCALL